jgi:hypothetical protein
MSQKTGWSAYQPTKTVWFWSCIASVGATLLVGFVWFGWVTGGTADQMATDGNEAGRATLAADLCVDHFMAAPGAAVQLAALKEESNWKRDDFIEDGGWTTFAGTDGAIRGAAELCADRLAEMDIPVVEIPVEDEPALDDSAATETEGASVN